MAKKKDSRWIQKATKSIAARGTEGVCTGSKFGGPSCRPGTRRYTLAQTFRKIARNRKKEEGGFLMDEFDNLPELSTGGILADVAQGAGTGALGGAAFGGIGAVPGALIGGGVGLVKGLVSHSAEKQQEQALTNEQAQLVRDNSIQNRLIGMQPQPSYMPVAAKGGFISYKGQSHEGDNGGVPVDGQGNPAFITHSEPVALTEGKEVTWYSPDEGAYVFSEKLGFAEPAQKLVNKYKLDEKNIDDPMLKEAVDKQFENLRSSQELKRSKSEKRNLLQKRDGGELPKLYNGGEPPYKNDFNFYDIPNMTHYRPQNPFITDTYNSSGNLPTSSMQNVGVVNTSGSPNYLSTLMNRDPQGLNAANYTNMAPSSSRFGQQYLEAPPEAVGQRGYGDWQDEVGYNQGAGYTAIDPATGQRMGLQDRPDLLRGATDEMIGPIHESMAPARMQGARGGEQIDYGMSTPTLKPVRDQVDYAADMSGAPGQEEDYNPMLSPLGHGLSAIGSIADYYAMKKAKPEELSLPRVGAERVSYARQRLADREQANVAGAMAQRTARNVGLSSGQAMTNIGAARTGINRQLGQQLTTSSEREANKNALLRQQAGMTNAQIAMQEGLYNNRLQNAYRAQMAQMNPLGGLARTAAGYFKDSAAYQRGWGTLQMMNPNAEIYQEPGTTWMDKMIGETRGVRFKGAPMKYNDLDTTKDE